LGKLIAFDDDAFDKLKQLARDRMASFQELADEAFADLLKKSMASPSISRTPCARARRNRKHPNRRRQNPARQKRKYVFSRSSSGRF
jgi:hypothetical protein